MPKSLGPALVAALLSIALLGPGNASAAAEVGNLCEANLVPEGEVTAVQLTRESPSPLTLTAPFSGVITSWRVNATFPIGNYPQRLQVLRGAGPKQFAVVAESATETVSGGISVFKARVPVEAGDRIGAVGKPLFCSSPPSGDVSGIFNGIATLGSSPSFNQSLPKSLLSLMASVEPDVDRDGYGDETQDLCTASAARQTACPPASTQAAAIVKKGRVLVLVTSTGTVSVTVGGTVKLPKRAVARLAPVAGTVQPTAIAKLPLTLPAKVKRALAALPKGGSLSLTAKITVTDEIGRVTTVNDGIKLR